MPEETVPNSFDDFMNPEPETTQDDKSEKETLEDRFARERFQWGRKVKEMSAKLKGEIMQVAELQTEVYTERQIALEYYHYIISLLIKINKSYNKTYSAKWRFYTYEGNERLPNESVKTNRIVSELGDIKEKREVLDNHAKFMDGTIKTIDNIIFGLKTRTEIEQIRRGR